MIRFVLMRWGVITVQILPVSWYRSFFGTSHWYDAINLELTCFMIQVVFNTGQSHDVIDKPHLAVSWYKSLSDKSQPLQKAYLLCYNFEPMTDHSKPCLCEWLGNRKTVLTLFHKNFVLGWQEHGYFSWSRLSWKFCINYKGVPPPSPPNDQEQCMCKVSCADSLDFIYYRFVVIILNQVNEVGHVSRVWFEWHSIYEFLTHIMYHLIQVKPSLW